MKKCLDCLHADYRQSARNKMIKFSQCKQAKDVYELSFFCTRHTNCYNGKFIQASNEIIAKRKEWLKI